MKQFDTVKNNEWVPTEEDLEGAIRVVDALPTASASEENITYLLNGTMTGYTKTHFYKCVKENVGGVDQYIWRDLNVGRYSVGNCTNIRIMMFDDGTTYRVLFSWKDPEDVEVGSEHIYWKETRLVHQIGHMPVDVNDGVDSFVSTNRDQYSVFGSYSTTIAADGRKHYFKLFPVSEDGAITNDDANGRSAGYNYVLTTDTTPLYDYDAAQPTKTYYFRSISTVTGEYEYTQCTWDSTCFNGSGTSADPYTFKTDKIYYEYQNAFIDWLGIRDLVKNGEAANYFPIKSILVLPYHGDFGEMSFEVVDYDTVQPADSSIEHTMTLQSKYLNRWWDYNGGVVFDTNERGGAITSDASRDKRKVYFKRLSFANRTIPAKPEAIQKIADVEGTGALYVESVFDATRRDYRTGASWSGSDAYECELPYVTDFLPVPFSNYQRDWTSTATAARTMDWFPSEVPSVPLITSGTNLVIDTTKYDETNYRMKISGDSAVLTDAALLFEQNVKYYKKTGSSYTELTPVTDYTQRSITKYLLGESLKDWLLKFHATGYSIWIPCSTTMLFGCTAGAISSNATAGNDSTLKASYHITRYNGATKGTTNRYFGNMVDPSAAAGAWGGNIGSNRPNVASPRSNGYAEYFTACIPYSNAYDDHLNYDTSVKYYAPAEFVTSRTRTHVDNKIEYYTWRRAHLRDVTNDLYGMYRWLAEKAHQADAGEDRIAHALGDYQNTASTHGSWTMNVEKVCEDKIVVPTGDERWQAGKNYFAPSLSVATGTAVWGLWYYRIIGTGTTATSPAILKRIYLEGGMDIPTGTYSIGSWNKLVEGRDYQVGDLIPRQRAIDVAGTTKYVGARMPFFTLKRKAIEKATRIEDETEHFAGNPDNPSSSDDLNAPQTLYITSDNEKLTYTVLTYSSSNTSDTYLPDSSIADWRSSTSAAGSVKVYKLEKAYIWTLGDQDASGEYNKCTSDYRSHDPYNGQSSVDKVWPVYAPSNQLITESADTNTTGGGSFGETTSNQVYCNCGVYESVIGPYNPSIPEDSTKFSATTTSHLYFMRGKPTQDTTKETTAADRWFVPYQSVECSGLNNAFTLSSASGTYAKDKLYFDYDSSTDKYTLKTSYDIGGSIGSNVYTAEIIITSGKTFKEWKVACKDTLLKVIGLDFCKAQCGSLAFSPIVSESVTLNGLYWKTPNTERVAYGNHVWAQSNIRMYFNGPMDSTQEYMHTSDGAFKRGPDSSKTYTYGYYKNTGAQYVRLVEGSSNTSDTYVVGTSIAAWEATTGFRVYNRFPGGTPIGYKLDINRPDKYNDFGISPVMQYTFDTTLNQWVPKYAPGNCWWSETVLTRASNGDAGILGEPLGRPSINNGLIYDRLADMFWSNCVLEGDVEGGTATMRISKTTQRTGGKTDAAQAEGGVYYGGYSKSKMILLRNGTWVDFSGKEYNAAASAAARDVYVYDVLPRQSFLHGFLDCKYKRSNDQTKVTGKDYYLKNPYGGYDKLDSEHDFVINGPYKHVLYELNANYNNDLKEAKNFLDGIIPVINRNGCYGTTGAYDFYPQKGACYPNLGGTITIDKVWLASTAQVCGGQGDNNGIYENPARGSDSKISGSAYLGKYDQNDNERRKKKGLTLGSHGKSGYADAMTSEQYWWLRSAGGFPDLEVSRQNSFGTSGIGNDASPMVGIVAQFWSPAISTDYKRDARLSPLITLG